MPSLMWRKQELYSGEIYKLPSPGPNVADPGCLSRIPVLIFTIPDPKTATQERGEKNYLSNLFFSHKFHKIKKILYF
jgi:hypothetical protein